MNRLLVTTMALGLAGGCARRTTTGAAAPAEELEAALRPAAQAAALRKLGGAHLTAVTTFRVATTPPAAAEDAPPLAPESITTTTELWLDRQGHYRLIESNDEDGGREIVLYGRELAVAVRPGHATRRPAQEPEPTRYLEEAVGGPWATWETVRRYAAVERTAPGTFRIARSPTPQPVPGAAGEVTPLRRWRDSVEVAALEGSARLDEKTGALLAFELAARFSARRDGTPLDGELRARSKIDGVGAAAAIQPPAAEPLRPRQRTVLEERALLGGLVPGKEAR